MNTACKYSIKVQSNVLRKSGQEFAGMCRGCAGPSFPWAILIGVCGALERVQGDYSCGGSCYGSRSSCWSRWTRCEWCCESRDANRETWSGIRCMSVWESGKVRILIYLMKVIKEINKSSSHLKMKRKQDKGRLTLVERGMRKIKGTVRT